MTPKEKAIELVDNYKGYVYCFIGSSMLTNDPDEGVTLSNAKHCARIAADEMIAENESILEMLKTHGDDRTILPVKFRIMFLKSVKEQIDQL